MSGARDTSRDAADHQRAAIRSMSPSERLRAAAALSDDVRRLAEAGVRYRHPEFSARQVDAETRAIVERAANRSARAGKTSTG